MVDVTIHGLDRGVLLSDENYDLEADTTATAAEPNPTLERTETPIYNFVIEHPAGTILWDSGVHPEAGAGHWPDALYNAFEAVEAPEHTLAADLDAAGFDVGDVDYVIQTHLHMDHAGGLHNFAGTDVPVFVHRDELAFAYLSATSRAGSAGYVKADFDHDLDWRIVHGEREQHFDGIEFVRLRGHTPGVLGMTVDVDGHGTVLFTSDNVEIGANYHHGIPAGPGICRNRDDWDESIATLQDIERRADATVVFGHDPDQRSMIRAGWP
jgi:N-acyl homoserine lactone hydrolase